MHDAPYRQLPLLAALLCAVAAGAAPVEELQAAKVMEIALLAREAGGEEWQKLGAIYADLAKKYPKDAPIRAAYGEMLWNTSDREGAMREWLVVEKLDPKNAPVLTHLADASVAMGAVRAGLDYYLRAAEAEPANAMTHFSIGNVASLFRHDIGRTEAEAFKLALAHFADAHRLAPMNAEFARGYAETFYLVPDADWKTALKVWEKYFEIAPDKNFALLNMARVHLSLGQADEARACLSRVKGAAYERQKVRLGERIDTELAPAKPAVNSSKPAVDEPPHRP